MKVKVRKVPGGTTMVVVALGAAVAMMVTAVPANASPQGQLHV